MNYVPRSDSLDKADLEAPENVVLILTVLLTQLGISESKEWVERWVSTLDGVTIADRLLRLACLTFEFTSDFPEVAREAVKLADEHLEYVNDGNDDPVFLLEDGIILSQIDAAQRAVYRLPLPSILERFRLGVS